jgi:hypothetical protein
MPLQNRVTPFGDIVAIPQRGIFTGNRGIIHDPAIRTLLTRRWASKAWLVCLCEFKGRRRAVMGRRSWTELFFLDEAVALAAGHRPCFFCRRQAAEAFRDAWAQGRAAKLPWAAEMDAVLHGERLDHRRKRLHAFPGCADELPDGSVIQVRVRCVRRRRPSRLPDPGIQGQDRRSRTNSAPVCGWPNPNPTRRALCDVPRSLEEDVTFDLWDVAQQDIWRAWMLETDPANPQPKVRPLNR